MKSITRVISKWYIAFACAVLNFLHLGLMRLTALQFPPSLERYNVNREQASFPYIFRSLISHLSGPVVGYLGCRFGLQRITILGCFLSSIALGACFFAEHIHIVTLLYGVILGFGFSMANNLLPSILNHHFKNDFMTANGFSMAGSSFGALAFVPFYDYILSTYGLSGSFLVLSAFLLNSVPAAMLLKEPQKKNDEVSIKNGNEESLSGAVCTNKNETISSTDLCQITETSHCCENNDEKSVQINRKDHTPENDSQVSQQTSDILFPLNGTKLLEAKQNNPEISFAQYWKTIPPDTGNECYLTKEAKSIQEDALNHLDMEKTSVTDKQENNLSTVSFSADKHITSCNSSTEAGVIQAKQIPSKINKLIPMKKIQKNNTWKAFSLFFNPLFLIISYIQSSFLVFVLTILTVEIDFAVDVGIEKSNGKYLLMFEALWNFIGRISMGWVVDKGILSVSSFSAVMFFTFGLSVLFLSFSSEIWGLLSSFALLGTSLGILFAFSPVMASEFFEGEKKVFAVASRFLLFVPFSFTISPLIGFFREGLGSYTLLFCFIAGGCFISSALSMLLPKIAKCLKGNNPH